MHVTPLAGDKHRFVPAIVAMNGLCTYANQGIPAKMVVRNIAIVKARLLSQDLKVVLGFVVESGEVQSIKILAGHFSA